ncbi:MAG: N-acetylmuramoyl-L-alanine amidase [Syntrophotaleaceae bacterium]
MHANASANRSVQGIETYYLNFSKNDKAAAVAARENGTSLEKVNDLEMILFDLMANSKINESSRLASEIQKSLVGNLSRHYSEVKDHGVRQESVSRIAWCHHALGAGGNGLASNKTKKSAWPAADTSNGPPKPSLPELRISLRPRV